MYVQVQLYIYTSIQKKRMNKAANKRKINFSCRVQKKNLNFFPLSLCAKNKQCEEKVKI